MPTSNYPGGLGDAATSISKVNVANNISPNAKDWYVIVADVTYQYQPGYDFKLFDWGSDANGGQGYTITQTTYMIPRSGAWLPFNNTFDNSAQQNEAVTWSPDGAIAATNYYNCPCITGVSTSCTVGTANPTAASGSYYIP